MSDRLCCFTPGRTLVMSTSCSVEEVEDEESEEEVEGTRPSLKDIEGKTNVQNYQRMLVDGVLVTPFCNELCSQFDVISLYPFIRRRSTLTPTRNGAHF